jgi:tetratricopeptide (TPR) repeat protein
MAEKAILNLPPEIRRHQTGEWATFETCNRNIGLTDFNRSLVASSIIERLSDPPYTGQLNHAELIGYWNEVLAKLKQNFKSELKNEGLRIFEEARATRPQNHWLRRNEAEFLEGIGDIPGALKQWQAVREILPHHQVAYFHMGRLFARLKQWEEARKAFETTLQLRPDLLEAYLELGQVNANQGDMEDALKTYAQAQQMRPEEARIYLRRASLYISQNQHDLARQNLQEAIRLRPSFWEAHYLMGIELARQEKFPEAQLEFETTLRFKPKHVSANFNLAVAIAKQYRYEEAITRFQETLRLDPTHQQAKQYLDALMSIKKK